MVSSEQHFKLAPEAAALRSYTLFLGLGFLAICFFSSWVSGATCGRADIQVIEGRSFIQASGRTVEVPSVTVSCIGCHDGTVASIVSVKNAEHLQLSEIRINLSNPGSNHPVDMLYPLTAKELVPRAELDARLALADGRVTCLTCHGDPSAPDVLTVPNSRSRLCLSCHLK